MAQEPTPSNDATPDAPYDGPHDDGPLDLDTLSRSATLTDARAVALSRCCAAAPLGRAGRGGPRRAYLLSQPRARLLPHPRRRGQAGEAAGSPRHGAPQELGGPAHRHSRVPPHHPRPRGQLHRLPRRARGRERLGVRRRRTAERSRASSPHPGVRGAGDHGPRPARRDGSARTGPSRRRPGRAGVAARPLDGARPARARGPGGAQGGRAGPGAPKRQQGR